MFGKKKIAALVAEFLGTGVLSYVFLTVTHSQIPILYFVALAVGVAFAILGLAFGRDMQLNPAYTVALWTGRRITTVKAISFIVVQLLGAWGAYALYKYLANGPIAPLPHAFATRQIIAEGLGTFAFAFAAASALYRRDSWYVRAVLAGAAYALGTLIASSGSIGFINPATAIASHGLGWAYIVGPLAGALVGVNLYALLFAPKVDLSAAVVAVSEETDQPEVVAAPVEPAARKTTTRKTAVAATRTTRAKTTRRKAKK